MNIRRTLVALVTAALLAAPSLALGHPMPQVCNTLESVEKQLGERFGEVQAGVGFTGTEQHSDKRTYLYLSPEGGFSIVMTGRRPADGVMMACMIHAGEGWSFMEPDESVESDDEET